MKIMDILVRDAVILNLGVRTKREGLVEMSVVDCGLDVGVGRFEPESARTVRKLEAAAEPDVAASLMNGHLRGPVLAGHQERRDLHVVRMRRAVDRVAQSDLDGGYLKVRAVAGRPE